MKAERHFPLLILFLKLLNNFIAEEKFQVVRLDREMQYEKGSDTIIIDGELMLMEERILKDYFLPEITEAQTVNGILNPLAKHECLVATNGHKKAYDRLRSRRHGKPYQPCCN